MMLKKKASKGRIANTEKLLRWLPWVSLYSFDKADTWVSQVLGTLGSHELNTYRFGVSCLLTFFPVFV